MTDSVRKKVIFVGGTAYSGSTFFDMMLANDPHGFSCGEVHAFFRPFRPHHRHPPCGCEDPGCTLWDDIRKNGEARLYQSIFERQPETRFIVDSSKSLPWITRQTGRLERSGIDVRHILIWKSPAQIAHSFSKRGKGRQWIRSWVNYHRLYFRLVANFRAVPYDALVSDDSVLEQACMFLGIDCFPGKIDYWNKRHHTLFGNTSARIHTREADSGSFVEDAAALASRAGARQADLRRNYRTIHAPEKPSADDAPVLEPGMASERIDRIETSLRQGGVGSSAAPGTYPAAGALETLAHMTRWKASLIGRQLLPANLVYRFWPQQRANRTGNGLRP